MIGFLYIDSSTGSIDALGSVPPAEIPPAPTVAYPYPDSPIHLVRKTPGIAKPNKAGEGNGHSRSSPKLHELYRWQLNQAVPAPPLHEIWHPPPSAYEGQQAPNQLEVHSRLSNPLSQRSALIDDDRTPTPLPAVPVNLALHANVNDPHRHSNKLPPSAEDQQSFGWSLQSPREPLNTGSDGMVV